MAPKAQGGNMCAEDKRGIEQKNMCAEGKRGIEQKICALRIKESWIIGIIGIIGIVEIMVQFSHFVLRAQKDVGTTVII